MPATCDSAFDTTNQIYSNMLIKQALNCLEERLRYSSSLILTKSDDVISYLKLQLAEEKNEVFGVLFFSSQQRLISFDKLFFGTVNMAHVFPRVIIQKALEYNASAVILAHNHPSGDSRPSINDKEVTEELKGILKIIDVKVLDHIVVTHQNCYSFAETGLL